MENKGKRVQRGAQENYFPFQPSFVHSSSMLKYSRLQEAFLDKWQSLKNPKLPPEVLQPLYVCRLVLISKNKNKYLFVQLLFPLLHGHEQNKRTHANLSICPALYSYQEVLLGTPVKRSRCQRACGQLIICDNETMCCALLICSYVKDVHTLFKRLLLLLLLLPALWSG